MCPVYTSVGPPLAKRSACASTTRGDVIDRRGPKSPPLKGTQVRAYIGLGSNLDCPVRQVRRARAELSRLPGSRLVGFSPLYLSPPLGPVGQPDYVNAVAALDTRLPPLTLLHRLFELERRHGRVRQQRWGPRTLDLDLLLYGPLCLRQNGLILPHPELHRRSFVLYPLTDLASDLVVPQRGRLAQLRARCGRHGLRPLPPWRRHRGERRPAGHLAHKAIR
jgi:2-amino-4-hydroxy-6-hydroxymethyldihydropteridine diphosphokinase